MNTVHFSWESIERAASERPQGYIQDIIAAGTLHTAGDQKIGVTLSAKAYEALKAKYREGYVPQEVEEPPPPPPQPPASGPGTELKALLKDWLGIQASPNCSCNARARQMDEWGPDLCEQNIPTIVGWLEEQATARKLPFVRFAAEQAVKLAIRRARKKVAR
jgi:hypothetical protein